MVLDIHYEASKAGLYLAAYGAATIYKYYPEDGTFRGVSIYVNDSSIGAKVQLTGYEAYSQRGSVLSQTTTGDWIILTDESDWQITGKESIRQITDVDAQKLINQIIKDNAQIIQNNLLCARFADRLTRDQKQTLYDLQNRLNQRNASLLNDGLVSEVQTSQPAGYADLQANLQNFMSSYPQGVGIVLTGTAVIVISCVVIASLATAAYYAYKAMAKESAQDVKFSDKLTKALVSKLTPEEYQQLLSETRGIVTKSSILSRLKGNYQWFAVAALAAFAGWGTYKILQQAK